MRKLAEAETDIKKHLHSLHPTIIIGGYDPANFDNIRLIVHPKFYPSKELSTV